MIRAVFRKMCFVTTKTCFVFTFVWAATILLSNWACDECVRHCAPDTRTTFYPLIVYSSIYNIDKKLTVIVFCGFVISYLWLQCTLATFCTFIIGYWDIGIYTSFISGIKLVDLKNWTLLITCVLFVNFYKQIPCTSQVPKQKNG